VFLASAANMVVAGAVTGATASAATRAQDGGATAGYVDHLLRADPAAPAPTGATAGDNSDVRGELTRLLATSFRDRKDLKPDDRAYLSQVVARRTGLSQADAEKRVDAVITEAKADLDAARKATLQLALWLAASLFLGAFAASIAAAEGGAIRDRNWGVPSRA
jgi:hypothetical protein